jgi:plasmid maintenance system antidote protein VapI
MTAKPDIQDQLRQAILTGQITRYRLSEMTGIAQSTLSFFVKGQRSITMDTAAKLAVVLGLELTPIKSVTKGR